MSDLIRRQDAIDALHMHLMYRMGTDSNKKRLDDWINSLPSAQGKPFNLPEIYIADGYDTIEGEDGNVGFGVYVPDENQIYVAGDVEGEIRARALLHEICHWVQAMCGRPFDEDEANEFSDIVYDALPSAQPEQRWIPCSERLPEIKQHVLLSCYGRVIYGRMISKDGNSGYPVFEICDSVGEKRPIVLETTVHSEFTTSRIIAWLPLPEPYREERTAETSDKGENKR